MMLGVIFVAIVTFMPEGLVPGSVRLWRRGLQPLRKRPAVAATLEEPRP